ncbi:PaaI family thioesterase [Aquihabitans sp. G128]|uniref:PaaI family thioesterase n=1 Tax=Aquihabitans sp. G128 TaxID=2849779 RepID=UPI001C225924|nr:PaaI family thioesterase [Aquihabitans sp. G128]QXC60008.1 PaaI family thioesterase [Aquihabitans sp. G128]
MDEHPTDRAERQALADETRRLLAAIRTTVVAGDDLERAAALVQEAAAVLELGAPRRPLWHTGLDRLEQFSPSTDPAEIFPFSPAMGPLNPMAPRVQLDVGDDRVVRGEVTFAEAHNGPPWDLAHGGVIALVYDELLGMAAMVGAGGGFTANLTVEYRKTTPVLAPVQLTAWLGEHEGRKFTAHGEMRHEGELLTEARGLFIAPRSLPGPFGVG